MLRTPSCGTRNLCAGKRLQIPTAAPSPPRFFRRRRRFGSDARAMALGFKPHSVKKQHKPKGVCCFLAEKEGFEVAEGRFIEFLFVL